MPSVRSLRRCHDGHGGIHQRAILQFETYDEPAEKVPITVEALVAVEDAGLQAGQVQHAVFGARELEVVEATWDRGRGYPESRWRCTWSPRYPRRTGLANVGKISQGTLR